MNDTAPAPRPEMGPAAKLAAFAVILAVVFGASFGVGRAVAPDDTGTPAASTTTTTSTSVVHEGPHEP